MNKLFLWTLSGIVSLTIQDLAKAELSLDNPPNPVYLSQIIEEGIITDIEVQSTESGVSLILEGDSLDQLQPLIFPDGNNLIIDLLDAQLKLLNQKEEFLSLNPTEEISEIRAINLETGGIRITVAGKNQAPNARVIPNRENLVLEITEETIITDGNEIEIVATQEEQEDDYFVPDATTATRTDTPIRDIPQSIQVVPQQVIRDQQVIRLDQALRNVSGIQQDSADPRGQRFQIRGFSNATVLRDGFRQSFGFVGNIGFPDLVNIERIEVLKGPSSVISGALEPGGVINLVSKVPTLDPLYEIDLRLGNRGFVRPSLDFSDTFITDNNVDIGYRLSAAYESQKYFRDFNPYVERAAVSPVLKLQLGDQTDLIINFDYQDNDSPADFGLVAIGDRVADIPYDRVLGEPDDEFNGETIRTVYRLEHRFSDNWKIRNAFSFIDYNSRFRAFFASNLDEETGDLLRFPIFADQPSSTYDLQTNIVGNFKTGFVQHKVLVGVDFSRREDNGSIIRGFNSDDASILNIFNPVYGAVLPDPSSQPIIFDGDGNQDAFGFYLQGQITLFDNLKLLAGFRYDLVTQRSVNRPSAFNSEGSTEKSGEDAISPRVGLVYQPIEPVSLYGSYSEGFFPNSARTITGEIIDPERSRQYEFGIKTELFDQKMRATLAYFNITKRNVATPDPDNTLFSIATGEQNSQGVELDIIGEVLPGWNLIFNYAHIDARITEDNEVDDEGNLVFEGNRLFSVPKNSLNFWSTYEIQQGSLEGLGFGLGFNFVGDRFGDNANSYKVDGYFLTNAVLFYRKDNWELGLNIRNLFDISYIQGTENSRTDEIYPGEPFTIIGSFGIRF